MREYLFRGKRNDADKWVYGDLIHYESGETAILKKFSAYGYEATEIYRRDKVIPETVGQYTGLNDCNGVKIFEGDIVIFFNRKFVCEWNKVSCQFTLKNLDENFGFNYFCSAEIEVIGNIHDTEGGAE